MRAWDELSEAERELFLLAEEEPMLFELPMAVAFPVTEEAVTRVREAVRRLVRDGLLWFWRHGSSSCPGVAGEPVDLTPDEVATTLDSPHRWVFDEATGTVADVLLYLTPAGEALLAQVPPEPEPPGRRRFRRRR